MNDTHTSSSPEVPPRARRRRRWLPWVLGPLLGALLVLCVPIGRAILFVAGDASKGRSGAQEHDGGSGSAKGPKQSADGGGKVPESIPITGRVNATVEDFGIDDLGGHRVLQIARLETEVDVAALRQSLLRIPRGKAQGIKLLIRRGESGQVSLAEAVHGGPPPPPSKAREKATQGMLLDIGPLAAEDVRLRIEMGATPLVLQLKRAQLRVQRAHADQPTRIELSRIQGKLASPDPLPRGIEIHEGAGVVNLEGDPLADFKVRVCMSRGELRLHIRVPERMPETTTLVADGDGFLGVVLVGSLNIVDWFKGSIEVKNGAVEVPGNRACEQGS